MTIISYAQNFEDIMLWRALNTIENGFYIDVGANDPIVDSVSFVFYQHGWRGIHVEPTQQYSDKLRSARHDEQVLQIAIGKQSEIIAFYEIVDTGLSTADIELAEQHKEKGFSVLETKVEVQPLSVVFEQCHGREIHWLKIDIEGLEKQALESWGEHPARPWILVIESTLPLTTQESFQDWEELVLEKDYIFAYFDGLNRFYVHEDHQELLQHFIVPPNVFDEIVLSGLASNSLCERVQDNLKQSEIKFKEMEVRAFMAESRVTDAESRAVDAEARAVDAEARAIDAETYSHLLLHSTSWRFTSPLRYIGDFCRSLKRLSLKNYGKQCLKQMALYIIGKPRLKRVTLSILSRFPRLKNRLSRITAEPIDTVPVFMPSIPTELEQLTPQALQVYYDLKEATKHSDKESD